MSPRSRDLRAGSPPRPHSWIGAQMGLTSRSFVTRLLLPGGALLGQMLSLELPISKFLKSCGEKGKKVHVTASVFSKREMEIYKLTGVWASFSCKKPTRPSRRWMVVSSGATRKVYGKTGRLGDFGKSQT